MQYSAPVNRLLTQGELETSLPNYLDLGLTLDHVDDLIYLATDPLLLKAEDDDDPKIWAPLHAWNALGQLQVIEAITVLLDLGDEYAFDVMYTDELPKALALMGLPAIAKLKAYLWDSSKSSICRSNAVSSLEHLAEFHREDCIAVLIDFLKQADATIQDLAGLTVCSLIELQAIDSIETIRDTFNRQCIDISIPGDLEDVEIALGIRSKRVTPRPNYHNHASAEMQESIQLLKALYSFEDGAPDEPIKSFPIKHLPKIGRNDPCPCGSGKKFKKCCQH
jgi:hypothetical protein